jgi:FMN phosphatase YigB (HAD superfamily)
VPHSPLQTFYLEELFLSELWQKLDRGDLTTEDAVFALSQRTDNPSETSKDIRLLIDYFVDHLDVMHHSHALFNAVSQHYPIYILSNFQDKPFDRLLTLYPFLNQAQDCVVSAKVKVKKPEPRIYEILLGRNSLEPSDTIFIDDLAENIAAATQYGIQGIHFTSPQQAQTELEHFLGISL